MRPLRVLHIITGLHTGGAEMMLYKLLGHTDRATFQPEVITLTPGGDLVRDVRQTDTLVHSVDLGNAAALPAGLMRLVSAIRRAKPDVVQTWMYHADLLGGVAARIAGCRAIAWGIQAGLLEADETSYSTRITIRACAALSGRLPTAIVCCGRTVREIHVQQGYSRQRTVVIPNAADTTRFRPDGQARCSVRAELGLPPEALLVGLAARFHPQKDHRTFVLAAARVKQAVKDAQFVLFGEGVSDTNVELRGWIEEQALSGCHLLGRRTDVARLMSALDVACLSSAFGEGLPNAIAEAMACAVPCVATDVGDSGWILGDTGRIVPPRDADALATGLIDVLRLSPSDRRQLGLSARQRVEEHFSMSSVARQYGRLYLSMTGNERSSVHDSRELS